MSQAPLDASEDPTSPRSRAYREANARQLQMLLDGVSNSGRERNCCFLNTGAGEFANVSAVAGLDHIGDGRAYALVDWDHDGDLDLWTTNRTGPRVQYLQNHARRDHHFLVLDLVGNGETTNRDAIGARVEVIAGGAAAKSIETVRAGEGFLAQSSKRLHFGLGDADRVEHLVVHWPAGQAETFEGLAPDRYYTLVQGSGKAQEWSRPAAARALAVQEPESARSASQRARIPLRYPIPLPPLTYRTFEGAGRAIQNGEPRPTLVNFWATWCAPCRKELTDFRDHGSDLGSRGLNVVALSVDALGEVSESDPEAVIEEMRFPFDAGYATPELTGRFELMLQYLFAYRREWVVPTSFLLDSRGWLAVIYIGPVDIEELSADIDQLSLGDEARLAATLPFHGRWTGEARHPNLVQLVRTFLAAGYLDDALRFAEQFESVLASDPESKELLGGLALRLQQRATDLAGLDRHAEAIESFRAALRFEPESLVALNGLAWMLATTEGSPATFTEAVQLAERAADATRRNPRVLDTLAAAYAAAGQFERAEEVAERAIDLARAAGSAQLVREISERRELYRRRTRVEQLTSEGP